MKRSGIKSQYGLTTVEFAICGAVYFIVLFGVIEVGRLLFTLNALDEFTRRGARLASVCPVSQRENVINTAIMNGTILKDILPENLTIRYLRQNLTEVTIPNPITTANDPVPQIIYVQVSTQGYVHRLLIPFINLNIPAPSFTTTSLAESLGIIPPTTPGGPSGLSSC